MLTLPFRSIPIGDASSTVATAGTVQSFASFASFASLALSLLVFRGRVRSASHLADKRNRRSLP